MKKKIIILFIIALITAIPIPLIFDSSFIFGGFYVAFYIVAVALSGRFLFGQQSTLVEIKKD